MRQEPDGAGQGPSAGDIDPGIFRQVLGRFGTGVTVLTTPAGDGVHGMTANAFMSGSLHPPLVVVSVGQHTRFHDLVLASGRMGISVLAAEQADYSRLFAGQLQDRARPPFEFPEDIPVVGGALATIATHIHSSHACGDHTLLVGRVRHLAYRDGRPLLFFCGNYEGLPAMMHPPPPAERGELDRMSCGW
jgi:flavin reductase (DIM6/NTAB) family NADH-FMN oxidoreductase RutF